MVRPGRTFVARMYVIAAKLQKMHFLTRLNKEFRSDLMWWHTFLQLWNGLSMLRRSALRTTPDLSIQTDASVHGVVVQYSIHSGYSGDGP